MAREIPARAFLSFGRSDLLSLLVLVALTSMAVALAYRNYRAAASPQAVEATTGDEVLLVFIGTSTCGWSNLPGLEDAVRNIRVRLRNQVSRAGKTFRTIGIAPEVSASDGIDFLKRFGPFNQILSGASWLNYGAMRYVWEQHPGPASTPQLLIARRELDLSSVPGAVVPKLVSESVVQRWVGAEAIIEAATVDQSYHFDSPDSAYANLRKR